MDRYPLRDLPVYLTVFVWICLSSLAVHYLTEDVVFLANLEETCQQAGAFVAEEMDHQDDLVFSATMINWISGWRPVADFSQGLFCQTQSILPLLPPPKV